MNNTERKKERRSKSRLTSQYLVPKLSPLRTVLQDDKTEEYQIDTKKELEFWLLPMIARNYSSELVRFTDHSTCLQARDWKGCGRQEMTVILEIKDDR